MKTDELLEGLTWMDEFTYDLGAEDQDGLDSRTYCYRVILEEDDVEGDLDREASEGHQEEDSEVFYDNTTGVQLAAA
eukprot:101901-Amphidinium_carterae.1